MSASVVALLAFLSMVGAARLGLFGKTTASSEDDTRGVVGLLAAVAALKIFAASTR